MTGRREQQGRLPRQHCRGIKSCWEAILEAKRTGQGIRPDLHLLPWHRLAGRCEVCRMFCTLRYDPARQLLVCGGCRSEHQWERHEEE